MLLDNSRLILPQTPLLLAQHILGIQCKYCGLEIVWVLLLMKVMREREEGLVQFAVYPCVANSLKEDYSTPWLIALPYFSLKRLII